PDLGPVAFDAGAVQQRGEAVHEVVLGAHRVRRGAVLQGEGGQPPGGLADVPLDGVQAEAAVGDVGGADVLGGGQQVGLLRRQLRAQRDLEGHAGDVDVVVAAGGGVQVDAVAADADGVVPADDAVRSEQVQGHVVLGDRGHHPDPAGFAHVGGLGQAVLRSGDVGAGAQAGEA